MTIHKIKLKEVNLQFIQQLQQAHPQEDMELEIIVRPVSDTPSSQTTMDEAEFWKIIALFNWEKIGDDDAVMASAITYLSEKSVQDIQIFQDILSEKLYLLDGQVYAQNIGDSAYQKDAHFSVDNFLYARCCVVANGKRYYEHILENPEDMPKNLTFEALLYLANEAHLKKVGKKWQYVPKWNFETFFNLKGWNSTTPRL